MEWVRSLYKGKIYLIIAFMLAGSSVVAAKYVSEELGIFTITFMSLFFAVITALLFLRKDIIKSIKKISKNKWKILILQALLGILLFRAFIILGLDFTTTGEAGIITGTVPAITGILTWFILKEKINFKGILGILFTLLGILILQGFPFNIKEFNFGNIIGNILILCAAVCEALFTTLSRKSQIDEDNKLNPILQSGIVSFIALILCTIPMILEKPLVSIINLSIGGWLALVWYGSIVTIAAFSFMFIGAKYCDGYTIAAFSGVIPITSLILSILLLKESIHIYQWIGGLFIFISIILMSYSQRVKT